MRSSIEKSTVFLICSEIVEPIAPMLEELLEILLPASTCAKRGDLGPEAKRAIEKVIELLESFINAVETSIQTALVPLKKLNDYGTNMGKLGSTIDNVVAVIDSVSVLTNPFKPLGDLMNKEITIPWFPATYGRGAGRSPDCPPSKENDAGLCYPKCRSG